MKIPSRFKLLGKTIEVKFIKELYHDEERHGYASYRRDEIHLQPHCPGISFSDANVEQTFLHELVHHICYFAGGALQEKLGKDYLHQNEAFVDLFSSILYQCLTTMEYDEQKGE